MPYKVPWDDFLIISQHRIFWIFFAPRKPILGTLKYGPSPAQIRWELPRWPFFLMILNRRACCTLKMPYKVPWDDFLIISQYRIFWIFFAPRKPILGTLKYGPSPAQIRWELPRWPFFLMILNRRACCTLKMPYKVPWDDFLIISQYRIFWIFFRSPEPNFRYTKIFLLLF